MTEHAALLAWPILFIGAMILDALLRRRLKRTCDFWQKMSDLQLDMVKEATLENVKAFKLIGRALSRFVVLGEPVDEYLDWMKSSKNMSAIWKTRLESFKTAKSDLP